MRRARIKAEGAGYYHIMSRAIEGRFIFGQPEKERFHRLMRKLEGFCGLRIVTYSILSSHWHILLEVPQRQEVSDTELIRRVEIMYGALAARGLGAQLREMRDGGDDESAERLKAGYTYRMYDLSQFCKSLKQGFSQYYNKKYERCGTLWNQRYRSILVEGSLNALLTMAAYIDLNAVRAGIVEDPKQYRWCGYGEAMGGSSSMSTTGTTIAFHAPYDEREAILCWEPGSADAAVSSLGRWPGRLRGLGDGRFVAHGSHEFTIIEARGAQLGAAPDGAARRR